MQSFKNTSNPLAEEKAPVQSTRSPNLRNICKTVAIFLLANAKRNLEVFDSQISRIRSLIFKRKYLMEDFNKTFRKLEFPQLHFHCASNGSNRKSLACCVPEIFAGKVERSLKKNRKIQRYLDNSGRNTLAYANIYVQGCLKTVTRFC